MGISEWKSRRVEVSGTTKTTEGSASRIRRAEATTAGWRKPASRPSGSPRSRSTTSPEFSIEPGRLVSAQRLSELLAGSVLAQSANSEADGSTDCCSQLLCQSLQLLVGMAVNPHARRLHANQHTGSWDSPSECCFP